MCKNQSAGKQPYWNMDERSFFVELHYCKILNPTTDFAIGKKRIYIREFNYILYIYIPSTLTKLCFGLVISNTNLVVKGRCVLPFGAHSAKFSLCFSARHPGEALKLLEKIRLVNSHQQRMIVGWTNMLSLTRCEGISMRELKMYWMYCATIPWQQVCASIAVIPRTLWTCGEVWLDDLKFKGWVKCIII